MDKIKDKWEVKRCMSPSHDFPNMLYIPTGQKYTHTCPCCGYTITVYGNKYSFCVQPSYYCLNGVNI